MKKESNPPRAAAKKKRKKWLRWRHRAVTRVLAFTLGIYTRLRYRIRVEKFREEKRRNYLILFNHQTAFDQFFVGMSFRDPVYYVASEDIFTKGWVSRLIRFLVAPIPIKKQSTDVSAVMNCIRVAREGGSVAMAPEGNRTFSGRTGYMNPTLAPLARKMGLPILLYRIEGGYVTHPRWSDEVRRGGMRSYVSRVIEPEEYKGMTDGELMELIERGLYVDESKPHGEIAHKRRAEYLERALYVCPRCGLSELHSSGATLECLRCHARVTVGSDMSLSGEGFELRLGSIGEWYDYQCELVNSLDVDSLGDAALHTARGNLWEVIPYKKRVLLAEDTEIALYRDSITAGELRMPFDSVSVVTVLGRNKLNIYLGDKVYQIKCDKRFNALRYMNLFYRYRNTKKETDNVKFLGL